MLPYGKERAERRGKESVGPCIWSRKKMTLKEDVLYSNVKKKWKGAGEI